MRKPHLWIIAGPNGAGKTTLVQSGPFAGVLADCEFINPDSLTLQYLKEQGFDSWEETSPEVLRSTFIRAANESQRLLEEYVEKGARVAIESVLSTRKYCPLVERVLELKGRFMLIYVALSSPKLSKDRVFQRTQEDGHDVPADKLEPRWNASLGLLPWFASRANRFWMLDNSKDSLALSNTPVLTGNGSSLSLHVLPSQPLRPAVSNVISEHAAKAPTGDWRFNISDGQPAQSAA